MRENRFAQFGILFAALAVVAASASAAGDPVRLSLLSLKDAIQEALDHNPEIAASRAEAVSKQAQIGPSGAYEDPMFEIEAMNYPVDTLSSNEFGMTGTQLSFSQKIPFPGKLGRLRKAAAHDYQSSQHAYSARQLQVIKEVKAAYFELFMAQKQKEILLERQNLVRQLIVVTRNKYTLGKAPQAELLAMQVEEANLLNQGLTLEKTIRSRSAELGALMGREKTPVIGVIPSIDRTPLDFSKLTLESLTERILRTTPTLKAAEEDVKAAQYRHSAAKWGYLPDFELVLRYTLRQPNMDDRGVNTVSAGVGISIPLWALSRQSQEVKGSGAEEVRADAMLTRQRNDVIRQVETLYAELQELSKRVQLFESALIPLARQAVVTGRASYLTGKLEYVALLGAINTRFQTEQELFEALAAFETKVAELEGLLGEPIGALK